MKRNLAIVSLCASLLFLFAACGEDTASNSMDNAMNDTANGIGDMLDEAGDMMDDAMDDAEDGMRSGRDSSGNTGAVMEERGRARYGSARNDSGMQNGNSGMQSSSGGMDKNTNATPNATLRGSYNNPTGTPAGRSGAAPKQDEQDDPAAPKTRWQLMLDNARVHDTDGFLLDGENPQNDTF